MTFENVLVLYKKSAYQIYFLDRRNSLGTRHNLVLRHEISRFKAAHRAHYDTLRTVHKILFTHGVRFKESYRGRRLDYTLYDLIITVGGDGTFLEAARKASQQVVIGINSAPDHSVGRFCIARRDNFEMILKKILEKKVSIAEYHRIRLTLPDGNQIDALNDVLICQDNPAAMCWYFLEINDRKEEQRSSGIWVATPPGSTGAVYSAGGKQLDPFAQKFQYVPRELYQAKRKPYRLKGKVLKAGESIKVTSLMRKGALYVDGAHQKYAFPYGSTIKIELSPYAVRTIRI